MKLVVAVTGASGAIYAQRLIEFLRTQAKQVELGVVLSQPAEEVWAYELGQKTNALAASGCKVWGPRDFSAPFASGSAGWDAMVVIPCSMGTLARISQGLSDDLIGRAADVMIKERRTLVLVPRETPYSLIHVDNMKRAMEAGALVLPASPSFYGHPKTIEELVDTVIGRVLDRLGIRTTLGPRWGQEQPS